jgi:hypothetical protein
MRILDAGPREDEVTSARSLCEPEPKEEAAKLLEPDARVGGSEKNLFEHLVDARHRENRRTRTTSEKRRLANGPRFTGFVPHADREGKSNRRRHEVRCKRELGDAAVLFSF